MTAPSISISTEIKHCLIRGFNTVRHLKHVHTSLLRFGLDQDNYLINMFLKSIFSFSNQSYARLVFNQTHQPNVFLWNTMIQGFVSKICFDEALQLFVSIRKQSFLPNNFTLPFVLKACSRLPEYKLGLEVHSLVVKGGFDDDVFVKTGMVRLYSGCGLGVLELGVWASSLIDKNEFLTNPVTSTALIDMYAKCGKLDLAWNVFKGITTKDPVVWNAIVAAGLAMNDHVKAAFSLFVQMEKSVYALM
ncbi:hypothetical protein POM88_054250 [Heracleum sosnowskyi]|uniref:Pentatricopeptide repeat-containing protein n=1 Tax=Heracleum sosnowskyi TaxID=360622 RepID=A0AAD8GN53_9APIA|nr:hypothetical protein POM88_054250 [Heracleum sosnowskyi]